jgi:hypothetical protein
MAVLIHLPVTQTDGPTATNLSPLNPATDSVEPNQDTYSCSYHHTIYYHYKQKAVVGNTQHLQEKTGKKDAFRIRKSRKNNTDGIIKSLINVRQDTLYESISSPTRNQTTDWHNQVNVLL